MQAELTPYDLQTNPTANGYAILGGYRISVDYAQAAVHFYQGEDSWGRLVRTISVEKWSGDWLIRTVGRFFQVEYQLADDKTTATIQRNGYLTVETIHKIGKASLYQRKLVDRTWDYCVNFRGEVGFGPSVDKAVSALRSRLVTRIRQEQVDVSLTVGATSQFTEQQLADFCRANGLTPGGRYSRQHLRQTILRQRKLNCEQFRNQLHYFELRINCK